MVKTNSTNACIEADHLRRRPQIIERGIFQQPLVSSYPNMKLKLRRPNQTLQMLDMKMTTNGRQPQIIESEKFQHPLVKSHPNLKLKLWKPTRTLL